MTASSATTTKGASAKPAKTTKTATTTTAAPTPTTPTTWTPTNPIAQKLSTKPNHLAKLQSVLPAGTDLNNATLGFKNFGQLNAAVNNSINHNIPFADLKAAMTGIRIDGTETGLAPVSLGQAKKQLRDRRLRRRRATSDSRMSVRSTFVACLIVAGGILSVVPPALAQGKGKGLAKGRGKTPTPTVQAASAGAPVATGIRQFGAWLDDASLAEPGGGWAAISLSHFRSSGGRQTDFPIVDGAVGLFPRVQIGITIPYYRLSYADGSTASGLGDIYLAAKVGLVDPAETASGFGLAVTPLVEILADPDPAGQRNFHWGAPVSVEWRQAKYRLYGSSGWFSRGAFFASGAVELPLTSRVTATGALVHTRALNEDSNADAFGLSKTRTDLSGGVAYFLAPTVAVYGSLGRTISAQDANAASLMFSAGVSFMLGSGQTVPVH